MIIKVLNRAVEPFQSTWEGVTRNRIKQWALLEIDGLPTSFQLTLDPEKALPAGDYTLAPESFAVTNGRLTMSRAVLVPVASSLKMAPPAASSSK